MAERFGANVEEIIEFAEGDSAAVGHTERILEIIAVVILAAATVATAWSGYQATRWGGVQTRSYANASALRIEADDANTRAGQNKLFDSQIFSQWLNAYFEGNTQLASLYENRFRAEFVPAFNAWLATDPLHNPAAPPGPLYMPEYVSADAQAAVQLTAQGDAEAEAGQEATETADEYVLNTVFLASALFLAGISGRFSWRPARLSILATSSLALAFGIFNVIRLPVH